MDKDFEMPIFFDHAGKLMEAYHVVLAPLCKQFVLPPLALDILLFIANHPGNATAKDVCNVRGLKSGIVSVHIERLESEGLVERTTSQKDRRRLILATTPKADEIVKQGREVQRSFAMQLLSGVSKEQLEIWETIIKTIDANVDNIRKNPIKSEVVE